MHNCFRCRFLLLALFAATAVGCSQPSWAQSYPTRPITLIVPFPAGGPTDTIGRIIAEEMRRSLGQPIVIENVSGAGGSIGVGRVARAAPDGYTLDIGQWDTHVGNGAFYPLQYDLVGDFAPVALITTNSNLIVARPSLPAGDLRGLIAWLKVNSQKASSGFGGIGFQVAAVYFQKKTGTQFALVARHKGFDRLIFGHFRMGKSSGATRSSMLRGTPG
jgi:tripartite-type tricarboxylate transporter receptor subunit TctC